MHRLWRWRGCSSNHTFLHRVAVVAQALLACSERIAFASSGKRLACKELPTFLRSTGVTSILVVVVVVFVLVVNLLDHHSRRLLRHRLALFLSLDVTGSLDARLLYVSPSLLIASRLGVFRCLIEVVDSLFVPLQFGARRTSAHVHLHRRRGIAVESVVRTLDGIRAVLDDVIVAFHLEICRGTIAVHRRVVWVERERQTECVDGRGVLSCTEQLVSLVLFSRRGECALRLRRSVVQAQSAHELVLVACAACLRVVRRLVLAA